MDSVILMLCGVFGMWKGLKFVLAKGDKLDPNRIWSKTFVGTIVKPHVPERTWECSCYSRAPLFCWREYNSHLDCVTAKEKKINSLVQITFHHPWHLFHEFRTSWWEVNLYVSVLLQNPKHTDVKMSFRLLAARLCHLKWTLLEMSCLRENRVDSVVLINLKLKGMLQQIFFSFSMTAVSSVRTNARQEIVNFSPHSVKAVASQAVSELVWFPSCTT